MFMEEPRSVPQTVQRSLETPNRVIVLVETLRKLHVHQLALRRGRVLESNTISQNKMVRSFDRAITNNTLVTSSPGVGL